MVYCTVPFGGGLMHDIAGEGQHGTLHYTAQHLAWHGIVVLQVKANMVPRVTRLHNDIKAAP